MSTRTRRISRRRHLSSVRLLYKNRTFTPVKAKTRGIHPANRSSVEFSSLHRTVLPGFNLVNSVPVFPELEIPLKRQRFISGAAVSSNVVRPTANLRRLEYVSSDVLTCVRRRQRREVLFATGGVNRVKRSPIWKSDSYINC